MYIYIYIYITNRRARHDVSRAGRDVKGVRGSSRECLGRHRKDHPGIGNAYCVCSKCLMSDNSMIK